MAKNNINETEKIRIKKRYTVGMIIAISLLAIGTGIAGLSFAGLVNVFASFFAGGSMIITGFFTALFAHLRAKNRLEARGQNSKVLKAVRKEDKEQVEERQNVVEENKQKGLNISKEDEAIREANRARVIGPNTFAVTEMDKETKRPVICKDHNDNDMIYNINGSNDQDIRRIIVSLTGNELCDKTDYVISIYDGDGRHNDYTMTNETFESNLMSIYKNVRAIKREFNMGKPQVQPVESAEIEDENELVK